MQTLDGKELARVMRLEAAAQAARYREQNIIPTLAIVVATNDPQADWYVRSLCQAAKRCAIASRVIDLGPKTTTAAIAQALHELAEDNLVHGILLQTPLPTGVKIDDLLSLIPPAKDIDGANPQSAGNLAFGLPSFAPATAEAVMVLLEHYHVKLSGRHAVVVGRSRVVGKPVAQLLLQQDATVTICHSKTTQLELITKQADILVVAAGKSRLITPAHVKAGAVVIDVGTNVTPDQMLVGDVDPLVAQQTALTPVPGGVGPVTTAIILHHTLQALELKRSP